MYDDDQYIDINELCRILSCCRTTAYRLLKQENSPLKHYKLGRYYKVRLRDAYEFIDTVAENGQEIRLDRKCVS